MTVHAYLFEAKFIQSYILAGNRLKEMIGASELIDTLCPDAVDKLCDVLGITERVRFSRNAGSACYLFSDNEQDVARFAAAWPLLVQQLAPGLIYAHARGHGANDEEAYESAHKLLLTSASRMPPELPQAGPLVQFAPRTGLAAVKVRRRHGARELKDSATEAKLRFAEGKRLVTRFAEEVRVKDWPVNLDPEDDDAERVFPFKEDRLLGVVHADGNGLGQLLMRLRAAANQLQDFTGFFLEFSKAVSDATQKAARQATEEVLLTNRENGTVPARPIVLGGDDLTMLVRADLALEFTQRFLCHFEDATGEAFARLSQRYPQLELPPRLTACAGITYVRAGHPFQSAYHLAESLCARAKSLRQDKEVSALAFHRVTTALVDDWETVLTHELTIGNKDSLRLRQTLEAYAVKDQTHLPSLDKLLELRDLLVSPAMARGPVRQLITLLAENPAQARQHYARWREVLAHPPENARNAKELSEALKRFDNLLACLTGTADPSVFRELPFAPSAHDATLHVSPLGDALALIAAGDKNSRHEQTEEAAA